MRGPTNLRVPVLDALHGNIQDTFNEYGVQIMSPNYEVDPSVVMFMGTADLDARDGGVY